MHFAQLKNSKIGHPADNTYYFLSLPGIIRYRVLIVPFLGSFDRTGHR